MAKKNNSVLVGVIIIAIGFIGLVLIPASHHPMTGMMQYLTHAQMPKGIAYSTLPDANSSGAKLLSKYCTQCHDLPAPGMHTKQEWPIVIHRMTQYIDTMHVFHNIKPRYEELKAIQSYLEQHAQIAIDPAQYPDLNGPDGIAFKDTCNQCHMLPEPKQHTQTEWPHVVKRMLKNMKMMGKNLPEQDQVDMITGYLQKHAK